MKNIIPKKIHFCWFGHTNKDKVVISCINTWKKYLPDYEIIEWNEDNYKIESKNKFSFKMYNEKKWAFVSDYARLEILYKYGGIYLDTDMYLLKSLDKFLDNQCFLGKEDDMHISAGIIGSTPNNNYILKCKEFYDNNSELVIPIPKILTKVFETNHEEALNVMIYEKEIFYPLSSENIKIFNPQNPPIGAYTVHMWNYSWGNPLNKLFMKIGIYNFGKKITEKIGIKQVLKKILRFE